MNKGRVYVTLNGYRWDDFKPYVFVSEDFGNSWKSISANLPLSPVNVIREDPNNEQVLYVGTDNGLYVSMDRGQTWQPFEAGMPNVPVHDLRIQKEEKHLIAGTHGRSIYLADIAPVSAMNPENIKNLWVAPISDVRFSPRWGNSYSKWMDPFMPSTEFSIYAPQSGQAKVSIKTEDGMVVKEFEANLEKGFNQVDYDLTVSEAAAEKLNNGKKPEKPASAKYYITKGKYQVEVQLDDKKATEELNIR